MNFREVLNKLDFMFKVMIRFMVVIIIIVAGLGIIGYSSVGEGEEIGNSANQGSSSSGSSSEGNGENDDNDSQSNNYGDSDVDARESQHDTQTDLDGDGFTNENEEAFADAHPGSVDGINKAQEKFGEDVDINGRHSVSVGGVSLDLSRSGKFGVDDRGDFTCSNCNIDATNAKVGTNINAIDSDLKFGNKNYKGANINYGKSGVGSYLSGNGIGVFDDSGAQVGNVERGAVNIDAERGVVGLGRGNVDTKYEVYSNDKVSYSAAVKKDTVLSNTGCGNGGNCISVGDKQLSVSSQKHNKIDIEISQTNPPSFKDVEVNEFYDDSTVSISNPSGAADFGIKGMATKRDVKELGLDVTYSAKYGDDSRQFNVISEDMEDFTQNKAYSDQVINEILDSPEMKAQLDEFAMGLLDPTFKIGKVGKIASKIVPDALKAKMIDLSKSIKDRFAMNTQVHDVYDKIKDTVTAYSKGGLVKSDKQALAGGVEIRNLVEPSTGKVIGFEKTVKEGMGTIKTSMAQKSLDQQKNALNKLSSGGVQPDLVLDSKPGSLTLAAVGKLDNTITSKDIVGFKAKSISKLGLIDDMRKDNLGMINGKVVSFDPAPPTAYKMAGYGLSPVMGVTSFVTADIVVNDGDLTISGLDKLDSYTSK